MDKKFHYPRVSTGVHPLTKKPEDSGYEIVLKSKASRYSKRKKKEMVKRRVLSTMSVGAVKRDFLQSTAKSTIRERCKSMFNQDLLSDVRFVVRESKGGSKGKNIPAHKFVLAISSPVFYAMFYGELAETKDSVEISDCEYESLLELFRFIYSDEANLTPDNVMQLMYLADKYMLPSLADKCSAFLQENLDASNVFTVLPVVRKIRRERSFGSVLESDRERNGGSCEIGWFRDNREVNTRGNGGERNVEYQGSGIFQSCQSLG